MNFPLLDELVVGKPYQLDVAEKASRFPAAMREVTRFHYDHCPSYRRLCDRRNFEPETFSKVSEIPYLPTAIFKKGLLLSVPEEEVFREIESSATSSGTSSRVGLDRRTSRRQTKCFNKVVLDRIGVQRRRFIILDEPSSIQRSVVVSARSSTIRSLLFCASDAQTCLNESGGKLSLDEARLDELLSAAERDKEPVVLFGFTFILYKYVVAKLQAAGKRYQLPPGSKVIHIGGWKKLQVEGMTLERLTDECSEAFGVAPMDVVDLYGFTEQSGLIYPTCERLRRHVPAWAEIIVRDPVTLEPLPPGRDGLLQFLTPIQTSYPGHSVLTEDIGNLVEVNGGCECGRPGTVFQMTGRAPNSELRGCANIMAEYFE